jgi:hypothetical protein
MFQFLIRNTEDELRPVCLVKNYIYSNNEEHLIVRDVIGYLRHK